MEVRAGAAESMIDNGALSRVLGGMGITMDRADHAISEYQISKLLPNNFHVCHVHLNTQRARICTKNR